MAEDVEKTEDPTPRRRAEARRKGQVAVSVELFTVANLFAVTLTLMMMGIGLVHSGMAAFREVWQPRKEISIPSAIEMLSTVFGVGAQILVPVFIAVVVSVILTGLAQTKGNFSPYRLKPQGSKMNPLKNLKRIIKVQGAMELGKSLAKVAVVGGVVCFVIARHISDYPGLSRLPLIRIVEFQLGVVFEAFLAGVVALLFIALGDYAWQRHRTEKSLKMSKTEVREERKQSEGDPQVKSRLRSVQYERARTRMMEQVPKADVVVTNPQHVSVALLYQREEMNAPKVLAKGGGFLAWRIREIARASGVPIVENPPLARALYKSVKVGQMIPERLFQAVAEVLAHVYRLDQTRARAW
jgi:flagellar biosynthetic protein FlhB